MTTWSADIETRTLHEFLKPKDLGPTANKVLKEIRAELQDLLHDVNETLDRMPDTWSYGDLAACLSLSIESTLEPLIKELSELDAQVTQHDMNMTLSKTTR